MTVQQKPQMETYTSISGRLHARRHPRVPRGRLVLPTAQETSRVCKGCAGCVISAPHAPAWQQIERTELPGQQACEKGKGRGDHRQTRQNHQALPPKDSLVVTIWGSSPGDFGTRSGSRAALCHPQILLNLTGGGRAGGPISSHLYQTGSHCLSWGFLSQVAVPGERPQQGEAQLPQRVSGLGRSSLPDLLRATRSLS